MTKEKVKDGRTKNGGARPGAGRKPHVQEAENCQCKKCAGVKQLLRSKNIEKCRARYRRVKADPEKLARLRDAHLMAKYGITLEDYNRMREAQNDLCAICGEPERAFHGEARRELAVDHCHETGKVRGLLCNSCNRGLGYFRDHAGIVRRALAYLAASADTAPQARAASTS